MDSTQRIKAMYEKLRDLDNHFSDLYLNKDKDELHSMISNIRNEAKNIISVIGIENKQQEKSIVYKVMDIISSMVGTYFHISTSLIRGKSRQTEILKARTVAIVMSKNIIPGKYDTMLLSYWDMHRTNMIHILERHQEYMSDRNYSNRMTESVVFIHEKLDKMVKSGEISSEFVCI